MGPGGYSNLVEQVIGQMPPNLQSVPGGGPPGTPQPGGGGLVLPGRRATAPAPPFAPLPVYGANPFAVTFRRY